MVRVMGRMSLKAVILLVSTVLVFLFSGISGCLPDPYSIGETDSLFLEFSMAWLLIDAHYSCFIAREDLNWDDVYKEYQDAARNLSNRDELVDLWLQMLAELEDPNVVLLNQVEGPYIPWENERFLNWDYQVWADYMMDSLIGFPPTVSPYDAYYLDPPHDSIGYIYISTLRGPFSWEGFFGVTENIEYCQGLILDLRMCTESGFETNAYYACGRFTATSEISYYRSSRIGSGWFDMSTLSPVRCYRVGSFQFTDPFVVLVGRGTMGAAEQLVLHLKTQEHITIIGDTTAGYANPATRYFINDEGTMIDIPDMVTYSLDSTLIMNSGIPPDILVPVSEADFENGVDPVLEAALDMVSL